MFWLNESKKLLEALISAEAGHSDSLTACLQHKTKELLEKRAEITSRYIKERLLPKRHSAPFTLQFEITYRCNLRCRMCYNASGALGGFASKVRELTDEEWLAVAEEGCKMGILEAVISGGEPLLRRKLVFRLLDMFKQYGVQSHLVTNGWYVTPEIVHQLENYQFGFIQVSIDGHIPEVHDHIRQVKGSWERATRALHLLSSHGLPTRLAHTVVKINYKHLGAVIDLAIALGAKAIIIGKALAQGTGNRNANEVLPGPDETEEFIRIFQEERKQKSRFIQIGMGMESAQQLLESYITPNRAVILRPNGDVRLGCVAPFSYGNVKEQSLKKIWENGANRGYLHHEVVNYIRDVLVDGEVEAVRQLNLPHLVENKFVRFDDLGRVSVKHQRLS